MDADRSQEHEDKGRVAKSFRRLNMFGKICKLQFFMLALIVCGLSFSGSDNHFAFQR